MRLTVVRIITRWLDFRLLRLFDVLIVVQVIELVQRHFHHQVPVDCVSYHIR